MQCLYCNGQGLVSTGVIKTDLSAGRKETCPKCLGTGFVGDRPVQEEILPVPKPKKNFVQSLLEKL